MRKLLSLGHIRRSLLPAITIRACVVAVLTFSAGDELTRHAFRCAAHLRSRCILTRLGARLVLLFMQVACWQPTAGPKRDVPTLDVCGLKIAVRVTLSRFTASLWIAVQERSLSRGS